MRAERWERSDHQAPAWPPVLRHSPWDVVPAGLAIAHGIGLAAVLAGAGAGRVPAWLAATVVAVGLWWGSNTVAHIHIHTPLFRDRRLNRLFACYLTAVLGVPQALWRALHLWHHAGEPARRRPRVRQGDLAADLAILFAVVGLLAISAPAVLWGAWLPGLAIGLGLCQVHGHFEHAGASVAHDPGVSCRRRFYNRLWLNDGYHAEHHRQPGLHWTRLPEHVQPGDRTSAWPPVLRWIDGLGSGRTRTIGRVLDGLEHLAMVSPRLQRWLVDRHACALRRALETAGDPPVGRVCVVGGGLFPRTILVLRAVLPGAEVTVLEARAEHIRRATALLDQLSPAAGDDPAEGGTTAPRPMSGAAGDPPRGKWGAHTGHPGPASGDVPPVHVRRFDAGRGRPRHRPARLPRRPRGAVRQPSGPGRRRA